MLIGSEIPQIGMGPKDIPTVFISSVTGDGLNELKDELWTALHE